MANYCVGPTTDPSGDGTNWGKCIAFSVMAPARGDVVYIKDGTYPGCTISVAETGGGSTAAITIKKATIADHGIATNWDDTFGDGLATFTGPVLFTTRYWIIDGNLTNLPQSPVFIQSSNVPNPSQGASFRVPPFRVAYAGESVTS